MLPLWRAFLDDDSYWRANEGDGPPWERYSNPWWLYQPGQIAERQLRWREEDADDMDIFPEEDYCEGDFFREEFGEEFGEDFDRNFFASDDQRLPVVEPFVRQIRKVGRNDPCPFGSGKKFKKCCLH